MDQAVPDIFGFHAIQLGLPALDALRTNRMPHRWLLEDGTDVGVRQTGSDAATESTHSMGAVVLKCDFDALPFPSQSIDLVVMPHSLELARDPHLTLREVERVLVPEGRLVILGFNPRSLWGLRQAVGRFRQWAGVSARVQRFFPHEGESLGYRRLRDWLRLLSFEVEAGRFGCYRPPLLTDKWLARWAWAERFGDRWWPVLGAVYVVVAVKRVRGMRLVGLVRKEKPRPVVAPAVVTNRREEHV